MDFEEYIRQGEPQKQEKGYAWQTAIGLQAVDGLKPSDYLIETARKEIVFTLCGRLENIFCHHFIKKLVEIICHTKYFYNFAFGDHSDYYL